MMVSLDDSDTSKKALEVRCCNVLLIVCCNCFATALICDCCRVLPVISGRLEKPARKHWRCALMPHLLCAVVRCSCQLRWNPWTFQPAFPHLWRAALRLTGVCSGRSTMCWAPTMSFSHLLL